MSNVHIFDDIYTQEEIKVFDRWIADNVSWVYHSRSGEEKSENRFFTNHDPDDSFEKLPEIRQILLDFTLATGIRVKSYERVYLNGQTYKLDGTWHDDISPLHKHDNHYTLLYMANSGNVSNAGNFEYIDPANPGYVETVEYTSGRFVLFPSMWQHRGLATTLKNQIRMTLAFKACEVELL